ncbi:transposase [Streptomyces chartreusis]|uniref:transposase n=1 Tax=Streptomyces chartreusis TaxID=1969 RepID=UPI003F4CB023
MEGAAVDGSHVRALKGGSHRTFAGRPRPPGSKHHAITDRHGTPLAVSLTSGNRHDVTQLMPLLDAIPRTRGLVGRPRHRPRRLFADRSYDYDKYRRLLRGRGITP